MKKLIFKKKVFKGMTLVEIMIALAIVVVMSSLLVVASASITKYLRAANNVNDTVAVQAPIAQGNVVGEALAVPGGVEIILDPDGAIGTIPLAGDMYVLNDTKRDTDEAGRNLNMKFIINIETTTEATTDAP
jgi:prepilin-type N-terminal cleavage/methylation domain-containing protein